MENVVRARSRRKFNSRPGPDRYFGIVLKDGAFELIVKDSGISISSG